MRSCLAVLAAFLLPIVSVGATNEAAAPCDQLPPRVGCIEVREELIGAGGVAFSSRLVASPLGTCDDVADCAKKAKAKCDEAKKGPAVEAELNDSDTECTFRCADGTTYKIKCPPMDQVADVDTEDPCEVIDGLPVADEAACIEAEMDFLFPGAADDLYVEQTEVTNRGVISLSEALALGHDSEGVIYKTLVPLGTCDDLEDCAKKANATCRSLGYGKAKNVKIADDQKSCSYACTGGGQQGVLQGQVFCYKKDDPPKPKPKPEPEPEE